MRFTSRLALAYPCQCPERLHSSPTAMFLAIIGERNQDVVAGVPAKTRRKAPFCDAHLMCINVNNSLLHEAFVFPPRQGRLQTSRAHSLLIPTTARAIVTVKRDSIVDSATAPDTDASAFPQRLAKM